MFALFLPGVLLFTTPAAVTVDFHAGPGSPFIADSSGTPLAGGQVVLIGTFPKEFDPSTNKFIAAWRGQWIEFGRTTTRSIFGEPGRFAETVTRSERVFDTRQAYLLVLATAGDQLRDDWSNVVEYGAFSGPWTFPSQSDVPPANSMTVSSAEVTNAIVGTISALSDRARESGLVGFGLARTTLRPGNPTGHYGGLGGSRQ